MNSTNKQKWIAGLSFLGVLVGLLMMQIKGFMGWGLLVAFISFIFVFKFKKHIEGEKGIAPEVKKDEMPKLGAGGWALSIFIVVLAIWGVSALTTALFFGEKKEQVAEAPEPYDDVSSYLYAKGVIEKLLKAPSSAEFQWVGDVARGGDIVKVTAYVDAENSFGAKLRSPWTVIFRDNEGRPELLQVVLDGKEYYRDPNF